MKKKYLYIFLTREGVTTLPNKSKEESDVYNMQYLGELETNEESEKNALNEFFNENIWLKCHYDISDFVIYKIQNVRSVYYL